jgi:hypothetical protein
MFRKAFAAIAALSLAATPALAQGQNQERQPATKEYHGPINRQTLVPLGIIVALAALVVAFTFHTRHNDRPTSP